MQSSEQGRTERGMEGRRPSQRHLRERTTEGGAEGAGPSKLINEINLSAIFGGKVGKGKRGRRAEGTWNKSGALWSAVESM